jgi:hypothetical protein
LTSGIATTARTRRIAHVGADKNVAFKFRHLL